MANATASRSIADASIPQIVEARRWAAGKEPPKPGLSAELAVIVADRIDELEGLAAELKQRGA